VSLRKCLSAQEIHIRETRLFTDAISNGVPVFLFVPVSGQNPGGQTKVRDDFVLDAPRDV